MNLPTIKPTKDPNKVFYKKKLYSRYPHNSDKYPTNNYFQRTNRKDKSVDLLLHREVWKTHYGRIPKNHVIHHMDGNESNNDISNLEILHKRRHLMIHGTGDEFIAPRKDRNGLLLSSRERIKLKQEKEKLAIIERQKHKEANTYNFNCGRCGIKCTKVCYSEIPKYCSDRCARAASKKRRRLRKRAILSPNGQPDPNNTISSVPRLK